MTATSRLILARGLWAALLLAAPAGLTGTGRDEPRAGRRRAVFRVLGARHLLQAAVTAWRPTTAVLTAGAATDVLHGASMAALAVIDDRCRSRAAADAALATLLAVTGARAAHAGGTRRAARPGPAPPRTADTTARTSGVRR
jgi:hypothetical protein